MCVSLPFFVGNGADAILKHAKHDDFSIKIFLYIYCMIFYFSCTGNTRWAAETLAEATHDRLVEMSVENIGSTFSISSGESIGFCFPVHGWRPPIIVREFLRDAHFVYDDDTQHFCYALCTAGDTVGEAMDIFKADAASIGVNVDSCASLLMPESYVGLPFMDVDNYKNEQRKKLQASAALAAFAKNVMARNRGVRNLHIGHWPKTNSRLIGEVFVRHIITDKHFWVDKGKCRKCGLCAKVCPVHDITVGEQGTPEWNHNGRCLSCFACYHHCPTHAIEYGRRTKNKGQYYYKQNKQT